jgi:hypothetical protein
MSTGVARVVAQSCALEENGIAARRTGGWVGLEAGRALGLRARDAGARAVGRGAVEEGDQAGLAGAGERRALAREACGDTAVGLPDAARPTARDLRGSRSVHDERAVGAAVAPAPNGAQVLRARCGVRRGRARGGGRRLPGAAVGRSARSATRSRSAAASGETSRPGNRRPDDAARASAPASRRPHRLFFPLWRRSASPCR